MRPTPQRTPEPSRQRADAGAPIAGGLRAPSPRDLSELQRTAGNRAVVRLLRMPRLGVQRVFLDPRSSTGDAKRAAYIADHQITIKAIDDRVARILGGGSSQAKWLESLPEDVKLDLVAQSVGDGTLRIVSHICQALREFPSLSSAAPSRESVQFLFRTGPGESDDDRARMLAKGGPQQYDGALALIKLAYRVGPGLHFEVKHTSDFAQVVDGNSVPSGKPYAVTVGSVWARKEIIVYVHDFWIDEWLVKTNQVGNLVNVLVHEAVHVEQRSAANMERQVEANSPVLEFDAYCREILETNKKVAAGTDGAGLPTRGQIDRAYESAREEVERMTPELKNEVRAKFDAVTEAYDRLRHTLEQRVPTVENEQRFQSAVPEFIAGVNGLRSNRDDRARAAAVAPLRATWENLRRLYTGLNRGGQMRCKPAMDRVDDLGGLLTAYERSNHVPPAAASIPAERQSGGPVPRLAPPSSAGRSGGPVPRLAPPPTPKPKDEDFGEFQSAS